jgi:poly(A) polymerase
MCCPDFKERPVLDDLAHHYRTHGYQLVLTGGAIRDLFLGRLPKDFDLVSDALPEQTERLLGEWGDGVKRSPNPFGVVTCSKYDTKIQVLTFHTPKDRYPEYDAALLSGDPLQDQLSCADVTIHTAALELPSHNWRDPFDGVADIKHRILRPPIDPRAAILSYPPTMLRYARFCAELGFTVAPDMLAAMTELAETIQTDWTWRSVLTLGKILSLPNPADALAVLRETTIIDHLPGRWREKLSSA